MLSCNLCQGNASAVISVTLLRWALQVKGLNKGYGDRLLINDLSFDVPPGAVVGICGGNGAGKSTLFKMILGHEKPDGGEVVVGDTVKPMYVEQSRDSLDGKRCAQLHFHGARHLPTMLTLARPACQSTKHAAHSVQAGCTGSIRCHKSLLTGLCTLRTVFEEIGDGAEIMDINGREVSVRAYCSWFNFKGGDQQKAVSVLSGGERNRLLLAKVCVRG